MKVPLQRSFFMKDVLIELSTIEKASELKEQNIISEEFYNFKLKEPLYTTRILEVHKKILEILKSKNFKIVNDYINDTSFLIIAQFKKSNLILTIRHQAQIYTVTKNKVEELNTSNPDKILEYLVSLNTEVKPRSNFVYISLIFIFVLGISGSIFLINETIRKATKTSKFEKNAVNICSKIIPNSKNYSISTKKISQNEIQVKFLNPHTHDYHIGIYLIDTQKCEHTR